MNGEHRADDEVANEILRLLRRISELEAAEMKRWRPLPERFERPRHDTLSGRGSGVPDRGADCGFSWAMGLCWPWPWCCAGQGAILCKRCCN